MPPDSPDKTSAKEIEDSSIDWPILTMSIVAIAILSVLIFVFPESSAQLINQAFGFITKNLGLWYIIAGLLTSLVLLILAIGPWRKIKFGGKEETPSYSTLSWIGMLFSTGIGTAVLYWGTIEWIDYFLSPPFDIEPKSKEAHQWAMSYGIFHWGLIGWAFYALPAVCLCFAYHVRGASTPSLAEACSPILRGATQRWPGRFINALFMIGLIGSASTGLGLTTPLITESFRVFFKIEPSFAFTIAAILLLVVLIALSVSLGLDRGIKRLSTINLTLMMALLALIYLTGPTKAITEQGIESIRFMIGNFASMSGIHYPESNKDFTEAWTVFYWAWWISFAPFVGVFICKISRGRTLGQLIWGVVLFGSLGCTLCFVVFGGYASYLELERDKPIIDTFSENRHAAVVYVVSSLPLGKWVLPLFFLLCVSFAATTYDSASYTLALSATRSIGFNEEPARWHRVLWAGTLGILPLALLSIGKQSEVLVALQTASLVVSVPMLFISGLMTMSLVISIRKHSSGNAT